MLSSTLDRSLQYFIPRKRDVSFTLSDGVTRLTDATIMDLSGTTPPTLVTAGILEASLWTPLISCNVLDEVDPDAGNPDADSDEEIDVVTTPPNERDICNIISGNFFFAEI